MKFKNITAAAVALLALSSVTISYAQQSSDSEASANAAVEKTQNQAAHLAVVLKLTDDQTSKWVNIIQNATQQGLAIRENDSLTPDQKQTQLESLKASALAQLRTFLTPAQQQKLTQLLAGPKFQPPGAGSDGNNHDVSAGLAAELKLTPQQSAQWTSILQASRQKGLAVFGNDSLSGPQKKVQIEAIHQGALSQLRSLLTPSQRASLDHLVASK